MCTCGMVTVRSWCSGSNEEVVFQRRTGCCFCVRSCCLCGLTEKTLIACWVWENGYFENQAEQTTLHLTWFWYLVVKHCGQRHHHTLFARRTRLSPVASLRTTKIFILGISLCACAFLLWKPVPLEEQLLSWVDSLTFYPNDVPPIPKFHSSSAVPTSCLE